MPFQCLAVQGARQQRVPFGPPRIAGHRPGGRLFRGGEIPRLHRQPRPHPEEVRLPRILVCRVIQPAGQLPVFKHLIPRRSQPFHPAPRQHHLNIRHEEKEKHPRACHGKQQTEGCGRFETAAIYSGGTCCEHIARHTVHHRQQHITNPRRHGHMQVEPEKAVHPRRHNGNRRHQAKTAGRRVRAVMGQSEGPQQGQRQQQEEEEEPRQARFGGGLQRFAVDMVVLEVFQGIPPLFILRPIRGAEQIEMARTDARHRMVQCHLGRAVVAVVAEDERTVAGKPQTVPRMVHARHRRRAQQGQHARQQQGQRRPPSGGGGQPSRGQPCHKNHRRRRQRQLPPPHPRQPKVRPAEQQRRRRPAATLFKNQPKREQYPEDQRVSGKIGVAKSGGQPPVLLDVGARPVHEVPAQALGETVQAGNGQRRREHRAQPFGLARIGEKSRGPRRRKRPHREGRHRNQSRDGMGGSQRGHGLPRQTQRHHPRHGQSRA